jgi:N-acyl homoserine lactone hydrolase
MSESNGVDRLHVIPTGWLRVVRRNAGDLVVPVVTYLAVSATRKVLIDTGYSAAAAVDPEGQWGPSVLRYYRPETREGDDLMSGLDQTGTKVGDITDVVMTHLHRDHAGGLVNFVGRRVWVQAAEYRLAKYPTSVAKDEYSPSDFDHSLDYQLLDGDGEILPGIHALTTQGHTPGHQSVLIKMTSGRWWCVVGDASDNRAQLDRRRQLKVATDPEAASDSQSRLLLLERAFGVTPLFSHDADQLTGLPSPAGWLT